LKNRYFIRISFVGTHYHGWQIQKTGKSVQEVITESLSVVLRETVVVTGAGRTDTGVHAKEFYAHFDMNDLDKSQRNDLVYHLNGCLPFDISIRKIIPVVPDAHARFSAVSRTYRYIIVNARNPFYHGLAYYYSVPLDIEKMNRGCEIIRAHEDFTSFAKLPQETKTNICRISEIYWERKDDLLLFTITSNRFLRNMVRAITGTLIDLGRNRIGLNELEEIINQKDRRAAGYSVPACGLYLTSVRYPDEIFLCEEDKNPGNDSNLF
jgi:tRNA pseudouridine38-40 synthase